MYQLSWDCERGRKDGTCFLFGYSGMRQPSRKFLVRFMQQRTIFYLTVDILKRVLDSSESYIGTNYSYYTGSSV